MEEASGVLGASGMLRQSPEDDDEQKASALEKIADEIDVEGNSDGDSEEGSPTVSPKPDQQEGNLELEEESGPYKEDAVKDEVKVGSLEKDKELTSDQKPDNEVSNSLEKSSACVVEEKPKRSQETEALQAETKKSPDAQSEKTEHVVAKVPGPSSGETGERDLEVVINSGSGLVTATKSASDVKRAKQQTATLTRCKEARSTLEVNRTVGQRKLFSFEDAFKASLGKLNIEIPHPQKPFKPKAVDSTSSRPLGRTVCHQDSERVIDLTEEGEAPETKHKGQSSVSVPQKAPVSRPIAIIDLKTKTDPEPLDDQPISVDSSDDGADNSKDIDNFSSDSSSTIIDIELTAKESTEEEIPGKSCKSLLTHQSSADGQDNQPSKSVMREEAKSSHKSDTEDVKPKLNPTSDTKSGPETSKHLKSSPTDPPLKGDRRTLRVPQASDSKEKKETERLQDSDSGDHGRGPDQDSKITKATKQKTDSPSHTQPSRNQGQTRKRSVTELSDSKLETRADGKGKVRERSKSEESQNVVGKKYRISKHGIVLQPGAKLEAMDYSRKWYLARIVNVDDTDNTVLIHFDGWNSRFDEWLDIDSDRLRPLARVSARRETAKEVKAFGGYKVGDEVLARWSDCRYYPAKILGIKTNGSYRVLFYDGIEKTVMGINVRDMPESLKSQQFFSNLENQFQALVNKKRRTSKDAEGKSKEGRLSKGSTAGSRPSSPVQQPQKRRHPSASQPPASQPAKRSRQDQARVQKVSFHKGQKVAQTPGPVPPSPTAPQDQSELLPSPTSSEASELMSALEQGMMGGKKRYREPLIFDKNSGLIRDPRRLIAPKELVIDLDHNKYKCEVPECSKAFRKASLLEYHKKYYHINKPATTMSAAAKNAVTRSRKRLSTSAMTPGSSKMRRTESLDRSPAKVASRPLRTSAPSVMTTSYKRPIPSPKPNTPTRPTHSPKASQSSQFLKRQPVTQPRTSIIRTEHPAVKPDLAAPLPAQQPQTLTPPKAQEAEVIPKVPERSRRVSGSTVSKEDKPSASKSVTVPTTSVEKSKPLPKVAAPPPETQVTEEPSTALPAEPPETKPQKVAPDRKVEPKGEVGGHLTAEDKTVQVTAATVTTTAAAAIAAVAAGDGPKKERRSKAHKKHKRHKTRTRDRRSREQSRSDRRRAAERAKQRRLEQHQMELLEGPQCKPEDVMEWTAKYLPPSAEKNLPHSPAHSSEDPSAKQEVADSSTTDEGGPRDMISCVCRNQEEEGFMIQCEACYGWQHGGCVGLTEHTIPKQYICNFCIYPENLRTHARHRYNQEWFQTGRLPSLVQPTEPTEESSDLTDSMLKTHQLIADMLNVTEALNGLQHKLEILKSDNHPDLKLWSYHWGLKDETTPLNDSAQNRPLQSSMEETDLQQTSAETSALTESMRSDIAVDGVTEEVVMEDVGPGTSDADQKCVDVTVGNQLELGVSFEMGKPQEGAKSSKDRQAAHTILTASQQNRNPENKPHSLDPVNIDKSPIVDTDKALQSSSLPSRACESDHKVSPTGDMPHLPFVPDSNTFSGPEPQEPNGKMTPSGKPTACVFPESETTTERAKDAVTGEMREPGTPAEAGNAGKDKAQKNNTDLPLDKSVENGGKTVQSTEAMKDAVTTEAGEPGTPRHSGKANSAEKGYKICDNGNSSDDEPLIKYTNKQTPASKITNDSSVLTADKASMSPKSSPAAVAVQADKTPSCGQTVPASVCRLNLFNHIVCVEEELKRRMDYVEEQIDALELAFSQSAGGKEDSYVPPDPVQMKQTIGVLMRDLDRVNKLVSI